MRHSLVGDLSRFDMRPTQFSTLEVIDSNPDPMQRDLTHGLNFEPSQLATMLNKLESQGLTFRVRCKSDNRSYRLFISKTGEMLLK